MRILICTRSGAGHFGPLVPFAKAFLRNNDEVLFTAPAEAAAMIADAGFDHHIVPDAGQPERQTIFNYVRTFTDPDEINAFVCRHVFIGIDARAEYPHLLTAIADYEPDLIVFEASEFAAALAAEATGTPALCVGITQAYHLEVLAPTVAAGLDELRAEFGLDPDPDLERLNAIPYMTLIPEQLEDPAHPGPEDVLRFRVEDEEPRPLPDWWENASWPLVYLTFGSVAPGMDWFPGLYRDALDALSLLPVRVLLTVGRKRDPRELGPVGPNVHVARWVPQADVLPHTTVMVCHGGSGTVTGGLAAGVPMVVLPLFADQPHNAKRVAQLGAGIALDSVTGLSEAVRRLLVEPSYTAQAIRVAHALRELPTVDAATQIAHDVAARAI
jgi:UDP:flavonoid glycosyltransferase YjiC (YdhE family)